MKIKQRREDFVVREISDFPVGKSGPYAVYKLEKSGIGTGEALQVMRQQWGFPQAAVQCGGRKDRHAITTQWVTIHHGNPQDLEERQFSLRFLGYAKRAFTAADIRANEFCLRIRQLSHPEASALCSAARPGGTVLNYFDQQRFGTVTSSSELVAVPWCLGNYEQALYLAIAADNAKDPKSEREQRAIMRENWGDWERCKALLERSNRRSVVTYLVDHPSGFKKAAALLHRDIRSLYVAALQSRLWNRTLALLVQQNCPQAVEVDSDSGAGRLCFPNDLSEMSGLSASLPKAFPLPSARPTKWSAAVLETLEQACAELGLERTRLRFSYPRDVFFSRANRPTLICPERLEIHESTDDQFSSKSADRTVELSFRLQRGQYATMFLQELYRLAGIDGGEPRAVGL